MAPKRKKSETEAPAAADKKKPTAKNAAADEGKTVVPFSGLPPGWRAVEKVYQSGGYAGQTYVRFESDRQRNVCTAKKAIELYCQDTGENAEKLLKEYQELKNKEKEDKKADIKVQAEARGKFGKEKREECIARFRDKYGQLSGALVTTFPGWRGESKLLENCGQLVASYYDPEGKKFMLMKDIEAHFGNLMGMGKEDQLPDIAHAKDSIKVDENGKPVNVARQENIVDELTATKRRKKEKVAAVVNDNWYREISHMRVMNATEKVFSKAKVPRADELKTESEELRILLTQRGFDSDMPLLYVFGRGPGCGVAHRRLLDGVTGFYYMQKDKIADHPHYKQVVLCKDKPGAMSCTGLYMFFSEHRKCWKLSTCLDDSKAGLFMCCENKGSPAEVKQPWKIYEQRAS